LHDRQLTSTASFSEGREQAISYRYKHGKIEPVDVASDDKAKTGPMLRS
jgi:hypothetical protein